jgi:RNA polymerase sigma-70 factor, ECF subfamily
MKVGQGGSNGVASERDGAAELFARYSAPIYRYCLRRLGSREEAEDALQATYLNAWRSLKGGFAPDNPQPWLFAIAANVCTSTLRTKLGGTQLELRDPEAFEDLVQVEQPEREAFLDLTEAVRELPERQRRALVLRDWHGLPYDEIAARMAVSSAAVETLLVRARGRVTATLASREWRRDLAASARALVLWPLGLIPAKSALAGGSAQMKAGLLVAGGTVAPLVAFGVLQTLVFEPTEPKAANRSTVSAPGQVTQVTPSSSRLERAGQARSAHVRTEEPKRRHGRPPAAQAQTDSGSPQASGLLSGQASGQGSGQASGQGPGQGSGQGPDSPSEPAPSQSGGKVTLCHQTKHGGVTITVSAQAAAHGHRDDPRGACA